MGSPAVLVAALGLIGCSLDAPDISQATHAKRTYHRARARATVSTPQKLAQTPRRGIVYNGIRPRRASELQEQEAVRVATKGDYRRYAVAFGKPYAVVEDQAIIPMALQSKRNSLKRFEFNFLKPFRAKAAKAAEERRKIAEAARYRTVRTTAYTHDEADHLIYGRKTAVGTQLRYGKVRSAAADWSHYPLDTQFRIKSEPGILYEVDDYGSALVGTGTIDLYKPTFSSMNRWGVRHVDVEVTKWGSFERSLHILNPRQRWNHVGRMVTSIHAKGATEEARMASLALR